MKTGTKILLVTLVALILVCALVFLGVMIKNGFKGTSLYETNTHEVDAAFGNISVTTDTADVVLAISDNEKCKVVCYENEKAKHSVTVEDGTLVIKLSDERAWYDHIGVTFTSPNVTVYLPKTQYERLSVSENTGNVKIPSDFSFTSVDIALTTGNVTFEASVYETVRIKTTTGSINTENISCASLDLSVSTGKLTASNVSCTGNVTLGASTGKTALKNISCKSLISNGSTGDVTLDNVIATENFSIERSTGDVKFNKSDAPEIYVKTSTGSVSGSILSDKIFVTDTGTGKINVPSSVSGGRCEIRTGTGDIKITVEH